ncbi:hypothetical protein FOL46_009402, partial [Perkinsus olseni]
MGMQQVFLGQRVYGKDTLPQREFFFTKAFLDMNRNGPVIVREEKDSRRPIDQNGERYRREREDTEVIRSTGGRAVEARRKLNSRYRESIAESVYSDDDDESRSLRYSSSSEEGSMVEAESRPVICRVPARDGRHSSVLTVSSLRNAKNRTQGEVAYRAECRREILNTYADLLRVGELRINGKPTRWRTRGYGKEAWFDHFELAFRARLRELERSGLVPHCDLANEITLIYWVCKLTSINYCLWEICSYIQQTLEKSRMVILETFDPLDPTVSILEYSLTLVGAATGSICMRWTKDNNIMYVNRHGQRKCKGTVKTVETQVPLRLLRDSEVEAFRPVYDVDMELIVPRSIGDRLASRLSCFNKGLGKFTDSSSLVSAAEPLMPQGSSSLRQTSYPDHDWAVEKPLLGRQESDGFHPPRRDSAGSTYSEYSGASVEDESRARRRAGAQQRLDELRRYRKYIRTPSGNLLEEVTPRGSREPAGDRRRSGESTDSLHAPQTPRQRYSRTGSQQSIPDEFDDRYSGDGRDHPRHPAVHRRGDKTPGTGSTVASKKSVTFASEGCTSERDQRIEARRRLAQLQQYRRYAWLGEVCVPVLLLLQAQIAQLGERQTEDLEVL